ncbi:MBL fold metallo-hydrolase [Alicyclobacillus shizuokensis]|uniref:MBL fold metallo-hydrolase n=1 Tax=Alicyclobacillus shizuokensis TaxID=392014 RepID=UPI000833C241|nr:MBL fold metallo-hydrolase [Alicyclobacillus shizuokensis]MCL6626788.1 MBL fold metallo-hydrolase [Alicyclobacillus shizuokensis]
MHVEAFVVSPFGSNCYVLAVAEDAGSPAVIVDPGDVSLDPVFAHIEEKGWRVTAVWNTHAHIDHVLGVDVVRQRYGVPAYVHRADLPLWQQVPEYAQMWLGRTVDKLAPPDAFYEDGDEVSLAGLTFSVWHTPGHSPGSVCLIGSELAFTGDTLFAGTIGRTDLPLSDAAAMEASLRRLLALDDGLQLYPGHMQSTSMAVERRTNPFLRSLARSD